MSTQYKMPKLAIVAGARTPQAKAFGKLADLSAVQLARHAVAGVLARANLSPGDVDETIFGNVAGPPDAANIARVIALQSGIPQDRLAHTVNRNCASGMESIVAAWHAINEGRASVVLAGGTESMSNIPMLARDSLRRKLLQLPKARTWLQRIRTYTKLRPKDFLPVHGIELGLIDPTCGLNMGQTAEVLAREFSITRDQQDAFAVESHRRAVAAGEECFMSGEIVPLSTEGEELRLDHGPRENQSMGQLAKLRPLFGNDTGSGKGTVTAGNSCPLTDGATALLLSSSDHAQARQLPVLGHVTDYAIAGCDPKRMGLGPVYATAKLLRKTGLRIEDFDLVEINEAFAAQVLACLKAFGSRSFAQEHLGQGSAIGELDPAKVNIHGGAIALGHPLGATGARIVLTLARSLKKNGLRRGLATLCVGGGQGAAMVVEV